MVKVAAIDDPPPGKGFVTITRYVPAVERSEEKRMVVMRFVPTKVTGCAIPLNITVEEGTNPAPLIVRSCEAAPAIVVFGNSELTMGIGLPIEPVTVNMAELVVLPLLLVTLTGPDAVP
jgi:hypothetical protein